MTITRLLRLLLLSECAAAVALAAGVAHLLNSPASFWLALLPAAVLIQLPHALLIGTYFCLSRLFASRPSGMRPAGARLLLIYAIEFTSSLKNFLIYQPLLARRRAPHPAVNLAPRSVALLFVHGYFCNRAVWREFMKAAAALGYSCEAVDLEPPFTDIDAFTPIIEESIERLIALTGAPAVVLICHSMGGLAARAWLRKHASSRVARIITLGTPHHGTRLAHFASTGNIAQMKPGNNWLADLAASESPARRALVTSIYSLHDDIVFPQLGSELAGARNLAISGVGHVRLVFDPDVRKIVFDELQHMEHRVATLAKA